MRFCKVFIAILSFLHFAYPVFADRSSEFKLSVLNMGYADASLLEFPSGINILVDTGSKESAEKLVRFIQEKQIHALDLVVITHAHDNHYGGLSKLSGIVSIRKVITSSLNNLPDDLVSTFEHLKQKNVLITEMRRGEQILLDTNIQMSALHPAEITSEPNADSLVLIFTMGNSKILFSADIPPLIQSQLIESKILTEKPDVVLLPHHGDELSEPFAHFIQDSVKIISAGPHELWHAPNAKTVERFKEKLFRTDTSGDLIFKINGKEIVQVPAS